jgi:hypothetical protein
MYIIKYPPKNHDFFFQVVFLMSKLFLSGGYKSLKM